MTAKTPAPPLSAKDSAPLDVEKALAHNRQVLADHEGPPSHDCPSCNHARCFSELYTAAMEARTALEDAHERLIGDRSKIVAAINHLNALVKP